MGERWIDIAGYEGAYQVSTRGRIRSLPRIDASGHRRKGKVLSPSSGGATRKRRRYYLLSKKGNTVCCCASVLLARAYGIPNPEGRGYVIHLNGDYNDFRRSNLQWATLAELRLHDGRKADSPYYGVIRSKKIRAGIYRWIVQLRHEGRRCIWRCFATPQEAAYAYDQEVKRRGLKRPLNDIPKPRAFRHDEIRSLPGEMWRPFPGADATHMISNKGRVRTLAHVGPTGQRVSPRLRKITKDRYGCGSIVIRERRYAIRKVVAQVFGDPDPDRRPSADA